jgi:hypothetical protein
MVSSLNNIVPRLGFAEDITILTRLGFEYFSLVLGLDWHGGRRGWTPHLLHAPIRTHTPQVHSTCGVNAYGSVHACAYPVIVSECSVFLCLPTIQDCALNICALGMPCICPRYAHYLCLCGLAEDKTIKPCTLRISNLP